MAELLPQNGPGAANLSHECVSGRSGEEERLGKSIFTPALSPHQCSCQPCRNQRKTHVVEGLLLSTAENTETQSSRDVSPTSPSRSTPVPTQTPERLCGPGTISQSTSSVSGAYLCLLVFTRQIRVHPEPDFDIYIHGPTCSQHDLRACKMCSSVL